MEAKRVIVGISGATGIVYGIALLKALRKLSVETHLVVSKAGQLTRAFETELTADDLKLLADYQYRNSDIAACIASGSYKTLGMVVAPCSMKTLAEIALGVGSNLISRAADVVLKERRKLVLLPREAPLHQGHLQNMLRVTEMGGIIYPPVPAFYTKPTTIEDLVQDCVGRVLDLFGFENDLVRRWEP